MNREWLLNFKELSRLSIPCQRCKTRVILDCTDREARIPNECPGCGEEYSDSFRSALQSFREIYRKLTASGERSVDVSVPVRED